jgi:GNAT superfamily N-acetyltransferase
MYTHPSYARRGVGRLVLAMSEQAAAAEGFTELELMSTLAGRPLYESAGFRVVEETSDASGGVPVPLLKMHKRIG